MSDSTTIREEAKKRYRDKRNIEAKWIDQYGNMSLEGDYQRNRSCLFEVFNLLDVVMELVIDDFRRTHAIVSIDPDKNSVYYTFENDDGSTIRFRKPSSFGSRVIALRRIGYPISDDLFYGTRLLRNETTHGNQTVILQYMTLGYEDTKKAMLSMADALITIKMLDPSLREPSFEMMRVREGDGLQNGVYTIGPLLGEGGMSRVYLAEQKRIGRTFAVKELKPGTYSEELIRQEYEVLSSLHHEQIPRIYDMFYENATYYIVMTYIKGSVLEGKIPDPSLRLSVCEQLLDVLEYLHSPDVNRVFADLSPDNIMIGEDGVPYLIDFGISAKVNERQSLPAATFGYAAPEVLSGGILDARTDIYSFGYILRFLYTGLSPLEKPEMPTRDLIEDAHVAEAINICTARDPKERFSSAAEIRGFLFPESKKPSGTAGKRKFLIGGACAAAAVILAAVILLTNSGTGHAQNAASRAAQADTASAESAEPSSMLSESEDFPDSEYELIPFEKSGQTDHVINWNDNALEAKMREITGIETGDIRISDVWMIPVLDLSFAGIKDISALAELTQLRELYLGHNEIIDASALSSLHDLSYLELQNNPLSNASDPLAFLENLPSLIWLDLNSCGLDDISHLAALTGLRNTDLGRNRLSDLSPLSDLTKLEYLDISGNRISDLSPLSGLTKIDYLNASDNEISGAISALQELTGMRHLYLQNNRIRDISALEKMTDLVILDLRGNEIEDYSVLDGLKIEELYQ